MGIEIRQIPDGAAEQMGLGRYNRSKLPGTKQATQAGEGPDGRWITGIDELALSVKRIEDPDAQKKIVTELKKKRERLEKALGVSLDASPTNDFWATYLVDITGTQTIDMANPKDELALSVLIANGTVAPNYEATSTPGYFNAKFYLHEEAEESRMQASKTKIIDRAKFELYKIVDNDKRVDILARYLLDKKKISRDMSPDTKYQLLSMYITEENKNNKISNAEKFINAITADQEELYTKIILDAGIAHGIIKFRNGLFQRGNATYGTTMADMLEFFAIDENELELVSIKTQLEKEFAFKLTSDK